MVYKIYLRTSTPTVSEMNLSFHSEVVARNFWRGVKTLGVIPMGKFNQTVAYAFFGKQLRENCLQAIDRV
jgi:hypothetical protein